MGWPYEGDIESSKVSYVSKTLYDMGWYEISLGDTIGTGTMEKTIKLIDSIEIPIDKVAAHFHNTYNRAIGNLTVALAKGISVIDSSVAGIGGCPYAKGASGNVPTEDVIYLLEVLGINHNINYEKLIQVGTYISHEIGKENLSKTVVKDFDLIEERRKILYPI